MLTHTENHLMLSEKSYNIAKKLVQIILPACASLYYGLAIIWGLPAAEEVLGTIAVITTFLGVILGVSTRQYEASGAGYDGRMVVVEPEDGRKIFSLELDGDPEDIVNRDSIRFKVDPHKAENMPSSEDLV